MDESIGYIINYLQDKRKQIVDRALSEDRMNEFPVGLAAGSANITRFAGTLGGGFFIGIIRR
jgi:hypothetical protein